MVGIIQFSNLPQVLNMESLLRILAGSVVAVMAIYLVRRFLTSPKNLPPGSFAWPIIGSLPLLGEYPHRSLAKLAEKYGPIMSVWFGQKLFIVVTAPEMAMEFVRIQDVNFCARPKQQVAAIILPHDVTFSDVTPHSKHLRKMVQTQFSTSKKMEDAQQLRAEEFAHMVRSIPLDGLVNLKFHLEVLAGNIFSQLVMSKRLLQPRSYHNAALVPQEDVGDAKKLRDLMTITADIDRHIGTFNPGDFIPVFKILDLQGLEGRFQRFRARMVAFIAVSIHERLEARKRCSSYKSKDYLDALLDEADDKNNDTDLNTVRSMIWQVFAAGMETSIASTEWAMSELVSNSEVMKKAQRELDEVVGRDRLVRDADMSKLPYMKAIVKESMRLHPPIAFLPRHCIQSCKALGYDIPAGANVLVNVWAMGRLATIYPDPLKFSPDRFLPGGANAGLDLQGQSFELLPFGSGRRICPGMPVGSLTVQSTVATLLHAFSWSPSPEHSLTEGVGSATLNKRMPLLARTHPRLAPHFYSVPSDGPLG